MTEQLTDPGTMELSQVEQNESLLELSELGVVMADAYRGAITLDPRLENVKLVPITDPNERRFGYAVPKWAGSNQSGQYEAHIKLDNLDEILGKYAEAMQKYPVAIEMIADRMHVDPSQVTPQLLYVQSFLHELGHTTDQMDNEADPDALKARDKREAEALPLGYHAVSKLLDPTTELRRRVDTHWSELSAKHDVDSIEDLARVQGEAYRNMTSEKHADMFAANVFDMNPQIVQQMTQPSVERYRNFGKVA